MQLPKPVIDSLADSAEIIATVAAAPANIRPETENPAIARCCAAMRSAWKKEKARGETDFAASLAGEKSYRDAMPPLTGFGNIRNFIACVAYGILIETIDGKLASQLLYAAQVALTARRRKPKKIAIATEKPTTPTPG